MKCMAIRYTVFELVTDLQIKSDGRVPPMTLVLLSQMAISDTRKEIRTKFKCGKSLCYEAHRVL